MTYTKQVYSITFVLSSKPKTWHMLFINTDMSKHESMPGNVHRALDNGYFESGEGNGNVLTILVVLTHNFLF